MHSSAQIPVRFLLLTAQSRGLGLAIQSLHDLALRTFSTSFLFFRCGRGKSESLTQGHTDPKGQRMKPDPHTQVSDSESIVLSSISSADLDIVKD